MIHRPRRFADLVPDLAAPDQADDDAGADDEGEDEPVSRVPVRGPPPDDRLRVGIVEKGEGEELGDEGVFDREH